MPQDANQLLEAAKCLECGIPTGAQLPVLISLFAQIANVSADPNTLMAGADCIMCIPAGAQLPVLIYLAQQILANSGGGSSCLLCGQGDPVDAPECECALYYDTVVSALWYFDSNTSMWMRLL